MKNRIDEEKAIEAEVDDIKKHLSLIKDRDSIIAAQEAIDFAILVPDERKRADFLKHKSREAIVRARVYMAWILREFQKQNSTLDN